ncbi:MAG: nucleotide sugar dehydrogenase [Cyanobacteria bacterium NC_groundwater_1444_Ag_S-0.65um_54_12]|nr:nucleotide sugar dehydrogenase [Cyanobacteria bacterium NC_groundwater_1444_Ag_S-0.65um_54_12]
MQELATSTKARLLSAIADHTAKVGVAGIGYVGLPLAVEKAKVGFRVLGLDRNLARVEQINQGTSYIKDVDSQQFKATCEQGRLSATTDFSRLAECDVVVICVPTPLTAHRDPDISYIETVGKQLASSLRVGQLICLESTTYPGTTEEVLLPLLATSGLTVGQDFFLAFSPERVDPGNARYTTKNTNKIVGGITPACQEVAETFYRQTILQVIGVTSPRVAEMTKVFENTFRAVNIALVNELALLCDRMDIDVWEVVASASTKPFGMMTFWPGPGVGGHCIPIDPFYLTWKAREYDFHTRFIELAGEINALMPYFVREKIVRALAQDRKSIGGAKILLVGVSYKRDIDDWRESPALKLLEILERDQAVWIYHDQLVPEFTWREQCHHSSDLLSAASWADCTVIMTDHSDVAWDELVARSCRVVDTRNATRGVKAHRERILKL